LPPFLGKKNKIWGKRVLTQNAGKLRESKRKKKKSLKGGAERGILREKELPYGEIT